MGVVFTWQSIFLQLVFVLDLVVLLGGPTLGFHSLGVAISGRCIWYLICLTAVSSSIYLVHQQSLPVYLIQF